MHWDESSSDDEEPNTPDVIDEDEHVEDLTTGAADHDEPPTGYSAGAGRDEKTNAYLATLSDTDPETDDGVYEDPQPDDSEFFEEDEESVLVTKIVLERVLYDGRSFQRQYQVHREGAMWNVPPLAWTQSRVLDTHMKVDVITAWRSANPIAEIPWCLSSKGSRIKRSHLLEKYKGGTKWKALVKEHTDLIKNKQF
jgi:hypothetical protein